eukprot:11015597-Alexandrium_andersonii.AAC.1
MSPMPPQKSQLAFLAETSARTGMPVLATLEERAAKRRADARVRKLRLQGTSGQSIEDQRSQIYLEEYI